MLKRTMPRIIQFLPAVILIYSTLIPGANAAPVQIELRDGWALIRDDNDENGMAMSTSKVEKNAVPVKRMPSTVLKVLTDNGEYKDLFKGDNLTRVPALWKHNWWYQTELNVPKGHSRYTLRFNGISYRAGVWLNGKQVATPDEMTGINQQKEFDVSNLIKPGGKNILAVKIYPAQKTAGVLQGDKGGHKEGVDLTDSWVDWINFRFLGNKQTWAAEVPDRNAGFTGPVYLTAGGPVTVRYPYVVTKLPLPSIDSARLSVYTDLHNYSTAPVTGILHGEITRPGKPTIQLMKNVTLAPGEQREVSFLPESTQVLNVNKPDLWWPYVWGEPALYNLSLKFVVSGQVSDTAKIDFGIREVTGHRDNTRMYPNFPNPGSFYLTVNGRPYPVRGAAYTPDLLFSQNDPEHLKVMMRYAKDLRLNLLRREGKLLDDGLSELADKEGMPLMQGLVCCGAWEQWSRWNEKDYDVAKATVTSLIRSLRSHPSSFLWASGSDGLPPEPLLNNYHQILKDLRWQNAVVGTVSERNRDWSGIHMKSPYTWTSPAFWFDENNKAAHGSVAETGSNEVIPPLAGLKKFIPDDHLWPPDDVWAVHAGGAPGNNVGAGIRQVLEHRYGEAKNVEELTRKSQVAIYENVRAQFEAYTALNPETHKMTVFWMLNSPWPSFFGQLYGYDWRQGGGYFAAKKALQPMSVVFDSYSSGDRQKGRVWVVNNSLVEQHNLSLIATVYSLDGKVIHEKQITVPTAAPKSSNELLSLPRFGSKEPVWFVRLRLLNKQGESIVEDTWWQSAKDDIPDLTPPKSILGAMSLRQTQWADFTALNTMPKSRLESSIIPLPTERGEKRYRIKLTNPTDHIAFFVRASLHENEQSDEILPIIYDDNYITIYPGETRTLDATLINQAELPDMPVLKVEGYNL